MILKRCDESKASYYIFQMNGAFMIFISKHQYVFQYTLNESVWTSDTTPIRACWTFYSKPSSWNHNFAATTASSLLGRLFTACQNTAVGLLPFKHKSIREIRCWCWVMSPGSHYSQGFRSKALKSYFMPDSLNNLWIMLGALNKLTLHELIPR